MPLHCYVSDIQGALRGPAGPSAAFLVHKPEARRRSGRRSAFAKPTTCRPHHGQSSRPRLLGAKVLQTGVYRTVVELAAAEKISASYVSRVLRLTLLAPHIIESFLHGSADVTLPKLMNSVPER
jgi:hypothetical protein